VSFCLSWKMHWVSSRQLIKVVKVLYMNLPFS